MTITLEAPELTKSSSCTLASRRSGHRETGRLRVRSTRSCVYIQRHTFRPVSQHLAHAPAPQQATAAPQQPAARLFSDLRLTDREHDVAELAVAGLSYAQIARDLFVSQSTVSYHLSNIYAKCGVGTRHELTELARQSELAAA